MAKRKLKGLPVKGYTAQPAGNVDLVNEGKELEERVLRYLEKLVRHIEAAPSGSESYVAIGRTQIQTGFMWAFRGVFNPQRVALPEDSHVSSDATTLSRS